MASTGVKIDEFWKKIWAQNGLRIILVCDLGISVIISIVRGPSFKVLQTAVKLLDAARWKHHILLSKLNKKWNLTYYLLLLIIYGYITITIRYIWLGHCFFSGPSDTFRPSNLPNITFKLAHMSILFGTYDPKIDPFELKSACMSLNLAQFSPKSVLWVSSWPTLALRWTSEASESY